MVLKISNKRERADTFPDLLTMVRKTNMSRKGSYNLFQTNARCGNSENQALRRTLLCGIGEVCYPFQLRSNSKAFRLFHVLQRKPVCPLSYTDFSFCLKLLYHDENVSREWLTQRKRSICPLLMYGRLAARKLM